MLMFKSTHSWRFLCLQLHISCFPSKTCWLENVFNILYSICLWQAFFMLSLIPPVPSSLPQRVLSSYDSALASVFEPQTTNWVDGVWQRQKRNHWVCIHESVWEGDDCLTIHSDTDDALVKYLDWSKKKIKFERHLLPPHCAWDGVN